MTRTIISTRRCDASSPEASNCDSQQSAIHLIRYSISAILTVNRQGARPEPPLLPSDPIEAAKVIGLCRHLKLDVEPVARRVLPAAFYGATASDEALATTDADLGKGLRVGYRRISTLVGELASRSGISQWQPKRPDHLTRCCIEFQAFLASTTLVGRRYAQNKRWDKY